MYTLEDLFNAIKQNQLDKIKKMTEVHPFYMDHQSANPPQRTPLEFAVEHRRDAEIIKYLVKKVLNPYSYGKALNIALQKCCNAAVDAYEAPIDYEDVAPLYFEMIKLLIQSRIESQKEFIDRLDDDSVEFINRLEYYEYECLLVAAYYENFDVIKCFIENGVKPNTKLFWSAGDTPLTLCGKGEITLYLLQKGADPFYYFQRSAGAVVLEGGWITLSSAQLWEERDLFYGLILSLSTSNPSQCRAIIEHLNKSIKRSTDKNFFTTCSVGRLKSIFELECIEESVKKEIIDYGGHVLQIMLKDKIGEFDCSDDIKRYFIETTFEPKSLEYMSTHTIAKVLKDSNDLEGLGIPKLIRDQIKERVHFYDCDIVDFNNGTDDEI